MCSVGHTWDTRADVCVPCEIGTEKYIVGNDACIACPNYSALLPSGPHDMSSCHCLPGYADNLQTGTPDNDDLCTACPVGFYKSLHGPGDCNPWPANTTTLEEGSAQSACAPRLRIIVLTLNRPESLRRLLTSLQGVDYDGDCVEVDIWVDIQIHTSFVVGGILEVVQGFEFVHGTMTVHQRKFPAGLREQWLYTWNLSTPGGLTEKTAEIPLILEDDLEVSPGAWRWLRAAHSMYASREDIAGFALQRDPGTLHFAARHKVGLGDAYLFAFVGSWGYSPTARHWIRFSDWALEFMKTEDKVKPYVRGTIFSDWYKEFERQGRCPGKNCMWTILHLKYTSSHVDQYSVYVNLHHSEALAINHREKGVHYKRKEKNPHVLSLTNISEWHFQDKPPCFAGGVVHD